jgi:hypothetical protein
LTRRPKLDAVPVMQVDDVFQPGILTWTTPSGRRYTVTPEPYPS